MELDTIANQVTKSHYKSGILTGDVLKVLRNHPLDVQFDVVIADPPYNIGKDFGNNYDLMPLADYVNWTQKWLALCFELLNNDGIIYVYGFAEIMARISAQYPVDKQRWLVWHYTNKAVPSSHFWQRSHESILCLWKSNCERPRLEIDQIREPYTYTYLKNSAGKTRKDTESRFGQKGIMTTYNAHPEGALPRDVIKIPALAGGAGASERWFMCMDCNKQVFPPNELKYHRDHEILKHPTQKPMELTRRLIRSRIAGTNGRLLIPFAGSGSECVVAEEMGLEYRGIEINPLYVNFAKQWIRKHAIHTIP